MTAERLIAALVESVGSVPEQVPVHEVRPHTLDDIDKRARRFVAETGDALDIPWQRADWVQERGQTLVRLTGRARARIVHASGAMTLTTGLGPMDSPFDAAPARDELETQQRRSFEHLRLARWTRESDDLRFERLWQIKAAAASREGAVTDPVLFRTVGAFRHHVMELPVWGAASASVKLAGRGEVDTVAVQLRDPSGEVLDEVRTLPAEAGAIALVRQLEALMGRSEASLDDVVRMHWMRFGYLSLSGRKAQHVLEPVYLARVDITGEQPQGYVLAVNAGEKVYQPLSRQGENPVPARRRDRQLAPA